MTRFEENMAAWHVIAIQRMDQIWTVLSARGQANNRTDEHVRDI